MLLSDYFYLSYIDVGDLLTWIKINQLVEKNFLTEKFRWEREINKEGCFFSDTELLLLDYDILLLKVMEDSQAAFLAQTYQLEQQIFCRKIFSENKHVIILSEKQWIQHFKMSQKTEETRPESEKAIVLLKDEVSIKKSFTNWLAKKKI